VEIKHSCRQCKKLTETQTVGPVEQFQNFLASFQDARGEYKYRQRISQLAYHGTRHLMVDFGDLVTIASQLAEEIVEHPDQYLPPRKDSITNHGRGPY
jgi:DNA replicative helicase MCM subunit Mcm2 (Cdc46/Mcm family)